MLLFKNKKILSYTLTFILFCLCFTIFLSYYQDSFTYTASPFSRELQEAFEVPPAPQQKSPRTCGFPKDHIFFLKLHKCGSSTVQNILMRRGLSHGLNFVLPQQANYLGHPEPFDPRLQIGIELKVPDETQEYEIFTHHTRYHSENVRSIMPQDTIRVTILREPALLFESLFHFYGLSTIVSGYTLPQILRYQTNDLKILFENTPRLAQRIGYNQMAFDLGMDADEFKDPLLIQDLIEMMEKDFDLVMLSEYMEASLVLLADIMCWPLEEVTFIKLNARPDKIRTPLSKSDFDKLNTLNNVDNEIYKYFTQIFKRKIQKYGIKRMENDIAKLINLNQKLMDECVSIQVQPRLEPPRTYPIILYKLYPNAPIYCKSIIMDELRFTEIIRNQQIAKFKSIKRLQFLLKS